MEAIHILTVIYSHGYLLLIDVLGQGQLHDKTVHILILVQFIHTSQQFLLRHIILVTYKCRLKPAFLTSKHLVLDIGLAPPVVAHEHSYQVGSLAALGNDLLHLLGYLFLDGGRSRLSVDKSHFFYVKL